MSKNTQISYQKEKTILEPPLDFSKEINQIRNVIKYDRLSQNFPKESYDWMGNAYKTVSDLLEDIDIKEKVEKNNCLSAIFYCGKIAKLISATLGDVWSITRNNNTINYGPISNYKQEIKFSIEMPSSESATCLQGIMSSFNTSHDYYKAV